MAVLQAISVFAMGIVFSIIAINNLQDYETGLAFVAAVMRMDYVLPSTKKNLGYRSKLNSRTHHLCFALIILVEAAIAALCFAGTIALLVGTGPFMAQLGLGLAVLLFLVVFRGIAGQWFCMWENKDDQGHPIFNGLPDGHMILNAVLLILIFVSL